MEGIIFLLVLVGFFIKQAGSSMEKQKKKTAANNERVKQKAAEIRNAQKEKTQTVAAQPVGEGDSHMAFTSDAHGCVSSQKEYMGSLWMDSSEGEDACDPDLGHEREKAAAAGSVYANEIGRESVLDFSSRGLYQGVVMSEILARPSRRPKRRL